MEIIDRIFKLIEQNGTKMADFCRAVNVSNSTVANWKTRKTDPPAKLIPPICEFLGVSCEYLLTGKEPPSNPAGPDDLTEEQKDLLDGFSKLDKIEQQIIMGKIAEFLYNKKGTAEIATETAFDLSAHIGAKDRVR